METSQQPQRFLVKFHVSPNKLITPHIGVFAGTTRSWEVRPGYIDFYVATLPEEEYLMFKNWCFLTSEETFFMGGDASIANFHISHKLFENVKAHLETLCNPQAVSL